MCPEHGIVFGLIRVHRGDATLERKSARIDRLRWTETGEERAFSNLILEHLRLPSRQVPIRDAVSIALNAKTAAGSG